MNITLIIGLPASGKSTYAKMNFPDAMIVDDPKFFSDLPEDKVDHLVIVDPYLCCNPIGNVIERLQHRYGKDVKFAAIYFENNPEQCLKNASRRENKKVDELINLLSKDYCPPCPPFETIKVWVG